MTRFNAILGSLFVIVLIVGPVHDGLFGVILVVNTVIGVLQELRAKRTLDRLALLSAASAHAMRDGRLTEVRADEIVVDDVLELRPGDQVLADGELLVAEGLELDESLMSGEAAPVAKHAGDEVLSGCAVVAGTGRMQVKRVGDDSLARRIEAEARRFGLVRSELRRGINQILRYITWAMIPAGLVLVISQMWRSGQPFEEAVRTSVAGLGAMVPEGLVLLTTIAFALGAIRLARRRVLVQEPAAIEGLARIDVLCLDKTGTLTESAVTLADVRALGRLPVLEVLAAMATADPSPNSTMTALAALPVSKGWEVVARTPFSSSRKWSAIEFSAHGTWLFGAPEVIMPDPGRELGAYLRAETEKGLRVMLLARAETPITQERLPEGVEPAGIVAFEEGLRPEAAAAVRYLVEQGVKIKVLSGDNPATVGAVARRVGVPAVGVPVDARFLPSEEKGFAEAVEQGTVFGRVQPHQKREMVAALQSSGHIVAMTGDGVNDVPALKIADLGIAMGSGSAATRGAARIVLLDNSFAVIPQIVNEGRRVIANVQRVAKLFVAKTVYATVLAVVVGLIAIPYPFYPRHLSIISALTIGIPGFLLALAPTAPRATGDFVARVLRFTLPAGIVAAASTLTCYLLVRGPCHATPAQSRTAATAELLAVGLTVLALVARPFNPPRACLVAAMAALAVALWFVPYGRTAFALTAPSSSAVLATAGVVAGAIPLLPLAVRWGEQLGGVHRRSAGNTGSEVAGEATLS